MVKEVTKKYAYHKCEMCGEEYEDRKNAEWCELTDKVFEEIKGRVIFMHFDEICSLKNGKEPKTIKDKVGSIVKITARRGYRLFDCVGISLKGYFTRSIELDEMRQPNRYRDATKEDIDKMFEKHLKYLKDRFDEGYA